MHAFEAYLGEDFFERFKTSIVEANIRKDVVIDDRFSFHVICPNNKQIDFTFLANPNLIVIGFPFRVKEKAHRIVQYRQYIKFHNSPMAENYWIEQMTRRIRGYMGGHYLSYPFVAAFEWAGGEIQLKSSVLGIQPFMTVFLVGSIIDGEVQWKELMSDVTYPELSIYDIKRFGKYEVTFDPVVPGNTQTELANLTIEAESVCPVAAFFGIESNVGEGIVWHPKNDDSGTTSIYFKVKGEKHSNVKVRKLATPNPEKLENVNKFIEYVITENRLEQGVKETGNIEKANMGKFLSWMAKDVMKEEADTLLASGLTWEGVAKQLTSKCMQWYKAKL